jgi:hypothetical protein
VTGAGAGSSLLSFPRAVSSFDVLLEVSIMNGDGDNCEPFPSDMLLVLERKGVPCRPMRPPLLLLPPWVSSSIMSKAKSSLYVVIAFKIAVLFSSRAPYTDLSAVIQDQ